MYAYSAVSREMKGFVLHLLALKQQQQLHAMLWLGQHFGISAPARRRDAGFIKQGALYAFTPGKEIAKYRPASFLIFNHITLLNQWDLHGLTKDKISLL